jgi:hypothetical protein
VHNESHDAMKGLVLARPTPMPWLEFVTLYYF